MPSLKVVTGPNADDIFPVRNGDTLGRDVGTEIPIAAAGVSRKHLRFSIEREEVWVMDLGSSNGTYVNGARVTRRRLEEGDVIGLSDVTLRYSQEEAPRARPVTTMRRNSPPTEPLDMLKVRRFLAETEERTADPHETYSVDATRGVTVVVDAKLTAAEQLGALTKRLHLVFDVVQALAAVRERDDLLGKLMDKLLEAFPQAEHGVIVLGPNADDLKPAIVRSRRHDPREKPAISRTIARKLYEKKHAILCHDASQDSRFAKSQSIAELDFKAFMVAPLIFREEVHGFIQLEANLQFVREDLNLLAALAASAASSLKTVKLMESIAREVREREAIQSELRVASRIQAALLPHSEPALSWLEVSGRMKTAREVGGDYYDFIQTPSGEVYVAIGDVSGKGVPAGLVMVMARSILHSLLEARSQDLVAVAVETNRLLKKDLKPGMFLSLLIAWCDGRTQTLKLAGCGHERPLVYRAKTKTVERIDLGGTVLGVVADNSKQVAEREIALEPGDQVLLYTDGATEAQDAASKPFTLARLEQALAAHGEKAPSRLLEAIEEDVLGHSRGREQHDDVTLIALRRR